MTDVDARGAVLAAIAEQEPLVPGQAGEDCSNDTIVERTGLTPDIVAIVLRELWRERLIEGVPVFGAQLPFLVSIRRVLPGRPPMWGRDGTFAAWAAQR